MGLDGGSIPVRIELVKTKEKEQHVDRQHQRRMKFFTCCLSGAALKAPVVACRLGRLYNKEAVLSALLAKNIPKELSHLRRLTDVFAVNFASNPNYKHEGVEAAAGENGTPWICPVTAKEIGFSAERFVANVRCGCVVSHELVLHAPDVTACYCCGKACDANDLIELCASDEVVERLREKLPKKEKKSKKKSKKEGDGAKEDKKKREGEDLKDDKKKGDTKKVKLDIAQQAVLEAQKKLQGSAASSLFKPNDGQTNSAMFMRYGCKGEKCVLCCLRVLIREQDN